MILTDFSNFLDSTLPAKKKKKQPQGLTPEQKAAIANTQIGSGSTTTSEQTIEDMKNRKTIKAPSDSFVTERDAETGNVKGITTENGMQFDRGQYSDAVLKKIAAQQKEKGMIPLEASDLLAQQQAQATLLAQQKRGAQLSQQVGALNPQTLSEVQRSQLQTGEILGSGLSYAAPGVIGGMIAGGATGTAFAPGVGTAIGAVVGGIGSFLVGARSSLREQAGENIAASSINLKKGTVNLKTFITAVNKDPSNAETYLSEFNEQLSYIERDHGILQLDTEGFLKDITGKNGVPELARYQQFETITKPYLIAQMKIALLNPDPSRPSLITPEDYMDTEA